MAFVVPAPGASIEPAALITWCKANMANYKVPGSVRVVNALPVSASGKVVKGELRKMARIDQGCPGQKGGSFSTSTSVVCA